jgi:metal-responsive CopG/Arc/MetJ family transcriptional regulator
MWRKWMPKIVIQVPVDKELLDSLDNLSKKQRKARADIIRQACQHYLKQVKQEELERAYEIGYKKIPEDSSIGESQIAMLSKIIPEEKW